MATTVAAVSVPRPRENMPDSLSAANQTSTASVKIPRTTVHSSSRHLPYCPPGSVQGLPSDRLSLSPEDSEDSEDDIDSSSRSLLFPPDRYERFNCGGFPVYSIDPLGLVNAVHHIANQPLPLPSRVFPWLHGLHPRNNIQKAFFTRHQSQHHAIPGCLRSITLVKANGNLNKARLKGALAPGDIITLAPGKYQNEWPPTADVETEFIDIDPKTGFSVRNFHIQSIKAATVSDIIVYGDNRQEVFNAARDIACAQSNWRTKQSANGRVHVPVMNTFVCVAPFAAFEEFHSELVSIDSAGHHSGRVLDFHRQESIEMHEMTRPTEISHNVWMGCTPNLLPTDQNDTEFNVFVECTDAATLQPDLFRNLCIKPRLENDYMPSRSTIEFPSSGSLSLSSHNQPELRDVVEICKWIYNMAHGIQETEREAIDPELKSPLPCASSKFPPRKILFHCGDGYTETTLLGIAYFAYSTGRPIPTAWLDLHTQLRRNFFAYPSDVAFLKALSLLLMRASPVCKDMEQDMLQVAATSEPRWFRCMDGSFPSRITDYMYLGSLNHANNPELLRALGITQVLSVGEVADWTESEFEKWGPDNVCLVQGVQDNGVDTLTPEFSRCFSFIDQGRRKGGATLVHCRVGVSRSATICIAEIMRSFNLSLPRAYCFVRARRLNVIIQPHLRFIYELLRWEDVVRQHDTNIDMAKYTDGCNSGNASFGRELEWAHIAREIALLNQPYLCH
ncbi:Dual specificity protein phosphatase PPS1 [Ceratocystis fimbriata CBS 114723]|uniref:Dual specificity protein phosphatase PPS1 n=1 Tax=Ceratocystis fimbriata CBS 114723 TaxID=1035309 RepID=A0A2C5X7Z3_9PEZI|nr:Dual specificity protein phosphatase PPS1 [Ceratocystis fimbriata CBS 114723]